MPSASEMFSSTAFRFSRPANTPAANPAAPSGVRARPSEWIQGYSSDYGDLPSGRKGSAFQAEDVVDVQQFRKAGAEVAGRYWDAHLCELSPFPITFTNLKTS